MAGSKGGSPWAGIQRAARPFVGVLRGGKPLPGGRRPDEAGFQKGRLGSPFSAEHRLRCITAQPFHGFFLLRPLSWVSHFPSARVRFAFGFWTALDDPMKLAVR